LGRSFFLEKPDICIALEWEFDEESETNGRESGPVFGSFPDGRRGAKFGRFAL